MFKNWQAWTIGIVGLIIIWFAQGCGVDINHKVSGGGKVDVNVTHKIDVENLWIYFASLCKEKIPTDRCYNDINDECVNCEIADFLSRTK